MNKLFSARSPIWQILIYFLGFGFFTMVAYSQEYGEHKMPSEWVGLIMAGVLFTLAVIYIVLIVVYNVKNPANRIRFWGLLPPELDEQDEVYRHYSYRAIRRIYIYYATLMPLAIIAAFLFPIPRWSLIAGLGIILIGHYIFYWVTVWPVWYLEDEEQ